MRSAEDADGEVLSELEPVVEDHDQIDVELYLKVVVHVGGARVRVGEQHVQGDLQVGQHVSVRNLNVLDLRGVSLFLESLYAHELNLNRLNLYFRLLQHQKAVEGFVEAAVD